MLGQIVKHFLSFPHDRHLSLHLPFVKTTNYQDGFKKIDFDSGNSYEKLLIYYGEFMYIGVEITSQEIYLPLMQGLNIFDKLTGKPVFLKVDISHWTTSQKDYITQQIEKCRAEARASRSYDYNSRKQPWLFFFGKQSPQNKFQFQLIRDDWRLLYCQTIQVSNLSNL